MSPLFKSKKTKFIIIGALVAIIIVYLVYTGIRDTRQYYLTPTEIISMAEKIYDQGTRLGGRVVDGSITWDSKNLILEFQVGDEKNIIPVVYKGVVPDTFKNGIEIVVEGVYTREGIFKASALFPKCPSKYEPAS